jgi:hypothetical protein
LRKSRMQQHQSRNRERISALHCRFLKAVYSHRRAHDKGKTSRRCQYCALNKLSNTSPRGNTSSMHGAPRVQPCRVCNLLAPIGGDITC